LGRGAEGRGALLTGDILAPGGSASSKAIVAESLAHYVSAIVSNS
jgi:hypothetical protein